MIRPRQLTLATIASIGLSAIPFAHAGAQPEEGPCGTLYDYHQQVEQHVYPHHSGWDSYEYTIVDSHTLSNATPALVSGYAQDHTWLGLNVHGECS